MHRWVWLVVVLGFGLADVAVAKSRRLCCCEPSAYDCSPSVPQSAVTSCDNARPAPTCRSLKPALCFPRVAHTFDPESRLQSFLKRWTDASRGITEVQARFRSIDYDTTFQIERRGEGEVCVRPDDRGWFRQDGTSANHQPVHNVNGTRYELSPAKAEEWYFADEFIFMVNRAEKSYEKLRASREIATARIQAGVTPASFRDWFVMLPHNLLSSQFLIPPSLEDLETRYSIDLVKENDSQIRLRLTPRRQLEQRAAGEVQVIVDKQTLHTFAVQRMDASREARYISIFSDHRVSHSAMPALTQPDLTGLRLIEAPKVDRKPIELTVIPRALLPLFVEAVIWTMK